jgi:hypothetical protein
VAAAIGISAVKQRCRNERHPPTPETAMAVTMATVAVVTSTAPMTATPHVDNAAIRLSSRIAGCDRG